MIDFRNARLLVVAPHPDDEIFGCGGLIQKVKSAGGKAYVLYLTVGTTQDFSKTGSSSADERIREIERVAEKLELDGHRLALPGNDYHLQLDALPQKRLIHEIERGEDISLEALKPTIIAYPSLHDYNQDHRAANKAVVTACRPVPAEHKHVPSVILEYEFPYFAWADTHHPQPSFFLSLEGGLLDVKLSCLSLYASQMKTTYGPISVEGALALARLRGIQSGCAAAEAFVVRRLVL